MSSDDLIEPLVDRYDQKLLFSDGNINRVVYNNKVCRLDVSTEHLICTAESKGTLCCMKLRDIIGCQECVDTTHHPFPHRRFAVFCYPRQRTSSSCLGGPFRRKRLQLSFTAINSQACRNLVNVIRTLAWSLPLPHSTEDGYPEVVLMPCMVSDVDKSNM